MLPGLLSTSSVPFFPPAAVPQLLFLLSVHSASQNHWHIWKNGQKRKLKFTYQEQKDYESIEGEMAALEDKIATLEADFSKYASDFVKLNELTQEKEAAEQQLEEKMERWMYLEDLAARIERGEEN